MGQETSETEEDNKELFHQDIQLEKGDNKNVKIYMKSLFAQKPDISVHKNAVVVEVQNQQLEKGNTPVSHVLDVGAKMTTSDDLGEAVDIKDIILDNDDKTMILHYIVYDLCNVDENSYISLDIEAMDGKYTGFVSASIVDLESFSIQCTDKESETFLTREQHGACESWDSKIWVFGGKRNVKKSELALNDIMVLDADKNSWRHITPTSGSKPTPRFGHVMFCYFNYLIVFGGQSQEGGILGDLWVFDTITEKWTFVLDNSDTHELSHLNVDQSVPEPRAFSGAVMIPELGAGYITGGLTRTGVA